MALEDLVLLALIAVAATLYSAVGHGGASGYLAAMALMGVAPSTMKPAALSLNILVAAIASAKYLRAGAFSWPLFWPFALASVPLAYLGGTLNLPGQVYKPVVGAVLLYSAWRFFRTADQTPSPLRVRHPLPLLLAAGAAIGFLSGLVGVGGGIFLSPLLLFFRWADVKVVSGISAVFILLNSIAGLVGLLSSSPRFPPALPYWGLTAVLGAFIGSEYGSKRLGNPSIQRILAIVLVIAGTKMIFSI